MATTQESDVTSPVEQVLTRFRAGLDKTDVPTAVCRAIDELVAEGDLGDRDAIYAGVKTALAQEDNENPDP